MYFQTGAKRGGKHLVHDFEATFCKTQACLKKKIMYKRQAVEKRSKIPECGTENWLKRFQLLS